MNHSVLDKLPLGNAIYPLLVEAQAHDPRIGRRAVRYPFFHPATITTATGRSYPAFSRDISAKGVGLMHKANLPLSKVDLRVTTEQGNSFHVCTRIVRCQSYGDGWSISGGLFVARTLHEIERVRSELRPAIREAREIDERDDPTRARHPCFRLATIILDSGLRYPAFTRDISENGIGLLHEVDLPRTEVEIHIATGRGYQVMVRTQILRSRPCGQDWYISNGRFASIPAIL